VVFLNKFVDNISNECFEAFKPIDRFSSNRSLTFKGANAMTLALSVAMMNGIIAQKDDGCCITKN